MFQDNWIIGSGLNLTCQIWTIQTNKHTNIQTNIQRIEAEWNRLKPCSFCQKYALYIYHASNGSLKGFFKNVSFVFPVGLGKGPVAIYYAPLRMRDDVKPINAKVVNGTAPPSSLAKPITSLGLTWRWRRSIYHLGVDWFDVIAHAQRSVVDSYGTFSQAHCVLQW